MSIFDNLDEIDDSPLSYSKAGSYAKWISINMLTILTDDTAEDVKIESDNVLTALIAAEGTIDSYLSTRYDIPIDKSNKKAIAFLRIATYIIATYFLYGRRGMTENAQYQYDRILRNLKDMGSGKALLPNVAESIPEMFSGSGFKQSNVMEDFKF